MHLGHPATIVTAAAKTLVAQDLDSSFIAAGSAACVFTLPNMIPVVSASGQGTTVTHSVYFYSAVDQNMQILPPAGQTLSTLNNAAAASCTFSTTAMKIGACAVAFWANQKWNVVNLSTGAAMTVA